MPSNTEIINNAAIASGSLCITTDLVCKTYVVSDERFDSAIKFCGVNVLTATILGGKRKSVIAVEDANKVGEALKLVGATYVVWDWTAHWLNHPDIIASLPGLYMVIKSRKNSYLVAVKDDFIADVNNAMTLSNAIGFKFYVGTSSYEKAVEGLKDFILCTKEGKSAQRARFMHMSELDYDNTKRRCMTAIGQTSDSPRNSRLVQYDAIRDAMDVIARTLAVLEDAEK